jgi:hypothetical protein
MKNKLLSLQDLCVKKIVKHQQVCLSKYHVPRLFMDMIIQEDLRYYFRRAHRDFNRCFCLGLCVLKE